MSSQKNMLPELYDGLVAEAFFHLAPPNFRTTDEDHHVILAHDHGASSALEVACGYGRNVFHFIQAGIPCEGIDISNDMIGTGKSYARRAGFDPQVLAVADMTAYAGPAKYDYVFATDASISLAGSVEKFKSFAESTFARLRPGGMIALTMSDRVGNPDGILRVRAVVETEEFAYVVREAGVEGMNNRQLILKQVDKFDSAGRLVDSIQHLHRNVRIAPDLCAGVLSDVGFLEMRDQPVEDSVWIATAVKR